MSREEREEEEVLERNQYDDGDDEECSWPDDDIASTGRSDVLKEKKAKSVKNGIGDERGERGEGKIEVEK